MRAASYTMDLARLESLGLTRVEARVYVALLELGGSKAGAIATKAGLNRTTTYYALERLVAKGLAGFSMEGGVRAYHSVSPSRLLEWLEEKREEAASIVPDLEALQSNERFPAVSVYRGRKGVKTVLAQVLRAGSYCSFGASGDFWRVMSHNFYAFQRAKRKLGVSARVLIDGKLANEEAVRKSHAVFRFLPSVMFTPATTLVFGDSVAIITWREPPLCILIADASIAKSYQNHFKALWKIAARKARS